VGRHTLYTAICTRRMLLGLIPGSCHLRLDPVRAYTSGEGVCSLLREYPGLWPLNNPSVSDRSSQRHRTT